MKGSLIFRNCIIMAVIELIVCIFCVDDMRYTDGYYYESYFDNFFATHATSDEAWMYIVFPILAIGLLLLIYDFHNIRKCKNIEFLHEEIVKRKENVKSLLESNGITNYDFSEADCLGCTDSYKYAITIKVPNLHKWKENKRTYIIDCIQKQNGRIYESFFSFEADLQFVVKDIE